PRGPSSLRAAGHGSIRSGGRSRLVPRAAGRPDQTPRTVSRELTALAVQKDLLLSGCRPQRYFSRERPGLFREGDFQIKQAALLASGARFVPCSPDASRSEEHTSE